MPRYLLPTCHLKDAQLDKGFEEVILHTQWIVMRTVIVVISHVRSTVMIGIPYC